MSKPLAILVGFGPGNGVGIARAFAAEGFQLALLARHPAKSSDQVLSLVQAGHTARAFTADAGDADGLAAAIDTVRAGMGDAEVLVYNAVAPTFGKPSTLTAEKLTSDFRTNVAGALAATLAVLPAMRARGSGTLLFTGGGWALYPSADATSVGLGKAALRNLTFALAEELRGSGVRAGTVTIMGQVAAGTAFDPDKIGRAFVGMYRQPTEGFTVERQFTGA